MKKSAVKFSSEFAFPLTRRVRFQDTFMYGILNLVSIIMLLGGTFLNSEQVLGPRKLRIDRSGATNNQT